MESALKKRFVYFMAQVKLIENDDTDYERKNRKKFTKLNPANILFFSFLTSMAVLLCFFISLTLFGF